MKYNGSVKITRFIFAAIFLLLLVCNVFTPMIADDYSYSFSFETSERITGIRDILQSLKAHAYSVNGRLIAHFWVQLVLLLPEVCFDVVNSLVFTLQIALIYKICRHNENNNLLLLGIFGAIWMYVPAFGQVYLWLDGSCNYLWSMVFGLFFILPYVNEFLFDKSVKYPALKAFFVLFSFAAGGYLENGSAAFIFMAVIFLILYKFFQRKKVKVYLILSTISAMLGYFSIYLSPAQWQNKSDGFSFGALRGRFINALNLYRTLTVLLIVFVVLFIIALSLKIEAKCILISLIFLMGSLCSNFMMVLALYYPERCAICPTILLIMADGVLFCNVFNGQYRVLCVSVVVSLMLLTSYAVIVGGNDIYETYVYVKDNETHIKRCEQDGIMDVKIPLYYPETKYSGIYGLVYISADPNQDVWPNCDMAKYYGVDSITVQ